MPPARDEGTTRLTHVGTKAMAVPMISLAPFPLAVAWPALTSAQVARLAVPASAGSSTAFSNGTGRGQDPPPRGDPLGGRPGPRQAPAVPRRRRRDVRPGSRGRAGGVDAALRRGP